ncbi:MAG: hypothetical protein P8P53_07720, partial [Tateyamaria sp.]|nr:hypothetical protein [Tateyamaria sp.]
MKKLLLASTALVATAGMAAAEITFSGSARFGAIYTDGTAAVAATGSAAEITAATAAVTAATTAATAAAATVTANTADGSLAAADVTASIAAAVAQATAEAALDAVDGTAATSSDTVVHNRFTLNIDGKTTIDSGAELFARVRVRG